MTVDKYTNALAVWLVDQDGNPLGLGGAASGGTAEINATDTDGNPVPLNKGHAYTYDDSGNLKTDTVSDASGTWVRTYVYTNGQLATDSGWVKQ